MAGKGNALQENLLKFLFTTSSSATLGQITTLNFPCTSTTTLLYVSLHTADPGNGGTQATNEVTYTGYQRVATNRSNAGAASWVVGATYSPFSVFPSSAIQFAQCTTASAVVITNWAVGTLSSGVTQGTTGLLYCGTVTPNINLGANVTPSLTTGSACTED